VTRLLELLVRAGMKPAQALYAATLSAARLMGVDDELGTLEPGKLADLVIADGDLLDIHDLANRIRAVYQDGVLSFRARARQSRAFAVLKSTPCHSWAGPCDPDGGDQATDGGLLAGACTPGTSKSCLRQLSRSPGWQSSASQSLVSVLNLIALARPFFRIDKFTIVTPTCSDSWVSVMPRSASSSSR